MEKVTKKIKGNPICSARLPRCCLFFDGLDETSCCPANASTLPKVHLYFRVNDLGSNESACSFNEAAAESLHLFGLQGIKL